MRARRSPRHGEAPTRILTPVTETTPRSSGSYLSLLRAHWFVATLTVLATIGGAVGYLQLRSDAYEATAEVLVTPMSTELQSSLALPLITEAPDATRVSQTAAALLRNRDAADQVLSKLPGDWDGDRVLDSLAIEPRGQSNVIALTARANAPELAAGLANDYTIAALAERDAAVRREIPQRIGHLRTQFEGDLSTTEREEVQRQVASLRGIQQSGDPTLSLSQTATPPTDSSSPALMLVIAAALMVGLALAFGAASAMAMLDNPDR